MVTTADLDGDQVLDFYWVDPIEAAKRFIIKRHDCMFVSVLCEYDKDPPGAKLCWICLNISNYSNFRCFAQSGSWPAVPASFMNAGLITRCFTCSQWNRFSESYLSYQLAKTGTIPYCMRQHAEDFVGAAFDTREGACDGSRRWYVNAWALSWSRERGEKWNSLVSRSAYNKTII